MSGIRMLWAVAQGPMRIQRAALEKHFPGLEIIHTREANADKLRLLMQGERCQVLMFGRSLDQLSEVIRAGERPLRAEMQEVGPHEDCDTVLADGRRLRFLGFVWVNTCELDIRPTMPNRGIQRVLNLTTRDLTDTEVARLRAVCAPNVRVVRPDNPGVIRNIRDAGHVLELVAEAKADRVLMPSHLWGIIEGLGNRRQTLFLADWDRGGVFILRECHGVKLVTEPLNSR